MKLENEALKQFYFGAYFFEETEDGYLQAYQHNRVQMEYFKKVSEFWYDRCISSNGKTIELVTEATELSFRYKILWEGSPDTFELAIDDLITQIYYLKEIGESGLLTFTLPKGKKKVTIYLPADATAVIKDFEINAPVTRPEKKEKVLWLGDSITQGFGPLRSSHIYVNVANRILNYDIINQGIGGYVYDKNSLVEMVGYRPDKIIVSMGTNQFETEDMSIVEEYYDTLQQLYGKEIPILCITPIWRGDFPEKLDKLIRFNEHLKEICQRYPNIKIVDGFDLVPHLPEYFLDGLHPNVIGSEVYGRNLVEKIRAYDF